MSEAGDGRIAVVTVHGTGETGGAEGDKWFQKSSAFVERLTQRLAARGLTVEVIPHIWSGANSVRGRDAGANSLAARLRKLRKTHGVVHIIGHSHGGNVANDAAVAVGWSGDGCKSGLATLTTVGTPFLRRDVGLVEWLASFAFLFIVRLEMTLLAIAALTLAFLFFFAEESARTVAVTAGLASLVFAGLWPIQHVARNGWLRVSRIRRRARKKASVTSIWHPNDEAIAFLRRVETLPLTAFPRGALWRGSHQTAINWGVRIVLIAFAALAGFWIAGALGVKDLFGWTPPSVGLITPVDPETREAAPEPNPVGAFGAWMLLYSFILSPFVFAIPYGATRLVAGAIPEWFMRGWYNGVVTNALKGIAFGRDGDERIGRVSLRSHCFASEELLIDGDLGERMQANSHAAADALIRKYRWSLFSVEDSADDSAMNALATDAMTWDSLIHTTYFDHPELADMIADRIAGSARWPDLAES